MAELLSVISLNWPAAICLIVGFGLVVVELFVPGFGAPGITGISLLILGIILAADTLLEAVLLLVIIVIALCLVLSISLRSASKGRLSKTPLVLNSSTAKQDGFTSGSDMSYFLGREGVVSSTLRPAGTADFDGVKLDVVSDGEFLNKGQTVKITQVTGNRILVRALLPGEEKAGATKA